jgi:hypothetical protein
VVVVLLLVLLVLGLRRRSLALGLLSAQRYQTDDTRQCAIHIWK